MEHAVYQGSKNLVLECTLKASCPITETNQLIICLNRHCLSILTIDYFKPLKWTGQQKFRTFEKQVT
jgi:hypothetical protein